MKQFFVIIFGVTVLVSLVVFGFTVKQADQERQSLADDLQYRTRLLADSLKESVEPGFSADSAQTVQKLLDKFGGRKRLAGLAVYDNKGNTVAVSSDLPAQVASDPPVVADAMDSDQSEDDFLKVADKNLYLFAEPLHAEGKVVGALLVAQNAAYIDSRVADIWKNNLLRLLVQGIFFAIALILIIQWAILKPIVKMAESMKQARAGKNGADSPLKEHAFFKPLTKEIYKLSRSLVRARSAASEEARMRLEKLDSPWTEERLKEFIKAQLKDRKIFVVSNREPYEHKKVKNEIVYSAPAGGPVTALEPVMEACGGMWIGYGSGDADKQTVDKENKIMVPPDEPKYTLKRVWLNEKELKGFYYGFSNEALWPLCHMAHTRPTFRQEDWTEYRKANVKFAQSLLEEIKNVQQPLVLVQDYHFSLLPKIIKAGRPDVQVGLFWHTPWPSPEKFSICPWRKEILKGMLGADIIGFHTQQYCNNFMETVGKEIESLVDLEQFAITCDEHLTYIKPFPISIAFDGNGETSPKKEEDKTLEDLGVKTKAWGLGVDRLDYTKGILERFKGLEFFFDSHPEFKGQFTFLQIAPLSRELIDKYKQYGQEVSDEAERINKKFGADGWQPIVLIKRHFSREELQPLYARANLCLVTSLHDGMNLVAKEFIAARRDEGGVLILSQFTGAARELKDALLINPYSAEQTAEAVYQALLMPPSEQHKKMKRMRENLKNRNIYRWSAEFIKAVAGLN